MSFAVMQSPTQPPPPTGRLRSKGSMSSLREAAATPLSRLRNKFFAVKATQNESGTEVDVLEISHPSSPTEDLFLSPSPHRNTSLKLKLKSPNSSSPALHKERRDEYLRKALQSASIKRSNTLPITPFTPHTTTLRALQPPPTTKPLPPSPSTSEKSSQSSPSSRFPDNAEWCSPRFILAVDPDWDPASGEATLFIFPQEEEDLQGDVDCVTLEEIWNGFFPGGLQIEPPSGP
ncbi:hypothetical protein EIP91_004380 [Steccherinum ochraceum]|uniref:Uncharacterized protein n=1 Tax=Steccherinum ochraceum TaxID=92696 RepID=A0A4R0RN38_9APHY|nr:hypothetical protein EIP91_004380 [Steccherinum ochraceum]